MLYYGLIVLATIMFSTQFFLTQGYQKLRGDSLEASLIYTAEGAVANIIMMLILSKFNIGFSWFSFLVAIVYSAVLVTSTYFSIKALKTANLSVYSMFLMLGGMLLPFLYGILCCNEELTAGKIVCCGLIFAAMAMTVQKGSAKKGAIKFYIICFILNGLVGVISKFHQSNPAAVSSQSLLFMVNSLNLVICFIILCIHTKKALIPQKKELKYSMGGSLINCMANLFLLIALQRVNASVQYPIVTGGTIVCSTIIALLQRERLGKKEIFAVIAAFLSTVFVII